MTNCVNCGAPLSGRKCTYCGTEYDDGVVVCTLSEDDYTGTLCVGGHEYKVYLVHMEGHVFSCEGRDMEGRLCRINSQMKHKFELVEF